MVNMARRPESLQASDVAVALRLALSGGDTYDRLADALEGGLDPRLYYESESEETEPAERETDEDGSETASADAPEPTPGFDSRAT